MESLRRAYAPQSPWKHLSPYCIKTAQKLFTEVRETGHAATSAIVDTYRNNMKMPPVGPRIAREGQDEDCFETCFPILAVPASLSLLPLAVILNSHDRGWTCAVHHSMNGASRSYVHVRYMAMLHCTPFCLLSSDPPVLCSLSRSQTEACTSLVIQICHVGACLWPWLFAGIDLDGADFKVYLSSISCWYITLLQALRVAVIWILILCAGVQRFGLVWTFAKNQESAKQLCPTPCSGHVDSPALS